MVCSCVTLTLRIVISLTNSRKARASWANDFRVARIREDIFCSNTIIGFERNPLVMMFISWKIQKHD